MQMSSAAFVFGQGAAGPVSTLTYSNIIKTAPCSVGSFAIGTTAQVFSERDFCLKGKERKPCLFICLRAYLSRSCLTTGQHAYKLCVCMYVCLSYTHLPENNSVSVQLIKIITLKMTACWQTNKGSWTTTDNSSTPGNIQTSNISLG